MLNGGTFGGKRCDEGVIGKKDAEASLCLFEAGFLFLCIGSRLCSMS
jgi:hypothetical protein